MLAGCGSSSKTASDGPSTTMAGVTSTASEQVVCPSEQKPGISALFGVRPTQADAQELLTSAGRVGFTGLTIERRGCEDYAVVLYGLRNLRQAREFTKETESVGFDVRIECRSHPVEGGLAAVFGHRPTKRAALRLQAEAERLGFLGLRVQQDRCRDWEVDLYGLKTSAQRHEFSAEAARVGFHIVYERG
jgi:cell division septation protein DedD